MSPLTAAFQPNASMETAHHMLLYGCETPGSDKDVWNCGEMALAQPGITSAPVCGSGSQVDHTFSFPVLYQQFGTFSKTMFKM